MTTGPIAPPKRRALWAVCATSLIAGTALVPQTITAANAVAADSCTTAVATYVVESSGSGGTVNPAMPRTLRKYVDWGPKSSDGTLIDTGVTTTVPGTSRLFTGGQGVIYEITLNNTVKAYKDNSASGGALLTPAKTYSLPWKDMKRVWSNGSRIFTQDTSGAVTVYQQSAPATGAGAITEIGTIPASAKLTEVTGAHSVWMVGSVIYTLTDGTITQRLYTERDTAAKPALGNTGTVASGLTDAVSAWSPGPGVFNTRTSSTDHTGIVRKYAGSPAALVHDEVTTGLFGAVMADTASCLADPAADDKPVIGTPPESAGTEAPATTPADPAPQVSRTVSGKFTLGSGQAAPGLPVVVTAMDGGAAQPDEAVQPTVLGTATTAADGSWTVTLPETLPAEVQAAVDDNGGALNVSATAEGTTSSGVPVIGIDTLVAAPEDPGTGSPTAFAAGAVDSGHSVSMVPASADGSRLGTEPTTEELKQTYAAEVEQEPVATDAPDPMWQSDKTKLPANFNPYLVDGKDISSLAITPYEAGNCYEVKYKEKSSIAYTTVGEAHAHYDATASFTYSESMASTIDIAVNTSGSNWSVTHGKAVSSTTGRSMGYTNKGPYYAKQFKVPLEYIKYKHTRYCGGYPRASWRTIEPKRYKIPGGQPTAKIGKDVRYKDGQRGYLSAPKSRRAIVPRGTFWELNRTKSIKWSGAATVFGVTVGASTQYDRQHAQRISAGTRSAEHDIWGKNDRLDGKPGIFFSF